MADPLETTSQFGRICTLLVSNQQGQALDLSGLHIKFSIKKTNDAVPNIADIRVYNLSDEVSDALKQKYFTRVLLQGGYPGNYGVIFQGNIKQALDGRESATETFIDIIAGDGDKGYNFAVVNKTLAAGATQTNQINACVESLVTKGVTLGYISQTDTTQLPRGKVMWGNARNYLHAAAGSTDSVWSIQNEKLVFLKRTTYLKSQIVTLTSKTGLIGTPQQTVGGINIKCLLNPNLVIQGRVQIDNKSVQKYKIDLSVQGSAANTPARLTNDGVYLILAMNQTGDNRGVEWYSNLICLDVLVSANPLTSVQAGY